MKDQQYQKPAAQPHKTKGFRSSQQSIWKYLVQYLGTYSQPHNFLGYAYGCNHKVLLPLTLNIFFHQSSM